ncbi:hypothetical protein [Polynucleobacter sp.]|uniref:hypothetical protein n=1 Tax=Polynucleobacter sp. TaxID=2029855 RepID=UPI003F69A284
MTKPKLKEHLYRDMVNELRDLVSAYHFAGLNDRKKDYGFMRTFVVSIVSKYIEAGE